MFFLTGSLITHALLPKKYKFVILTHKNGFKYFFENSINHTVIFVGYTYTKYFNFYRISAADVELY